jgi:hypothetical protein
MIRTPKIIAAIASSVAGAAARLRKIHDSSAANIGVEGEDEDEVGGRRVVDRRDEGDRAQPVERATASAGPARARGSARASA